MNRHKSTFAPRADGRPRIGLNLAGGGPLGGIYEIGALCALQESLDGIDFNDLDVYVGVSAGSLVAAAMANGYSPTEMYRILIDQDPRYDDPFRPELFLQPAYREYWQRALTIPRALFDAAWRMVTRSEDVSLPGALSTLGRAIPTGIFDVGAISEYLARVFSAPGHCNDFRQLEKCLYVIATDLDTGRSVKFGARGHDHVPISTAVAASCALPGLYPPVEIDGNFYVDGALLRTLHASVSLDEGAEFVICLNPLVPYDARQYPKIGSVHHDKLTAGGLPLVLSQTFRAIIHSRMKVGMSKYRALYPHADVVLFEPSHADAEMFFANVFSYTDRHKIAEHAYQRTRQDLLARYEELAPVFTRHGIEIRLDHLLDQDRVLSDMVKQAHAKRSTTERLNDTLDQLERWLQYRAKAEPQAA
ncbi:putative acylesterase/phospholipase RssA [Chitinivorax tropicus]|uniref:Putative acylesterase/phospholipase RssA n=1 Tax=Chitinivorax tropicus TaxID=714531 RepID=A0A840MPG2_9PROT|nr:patatin-like phospholipase family protein [Chitinivorax tropicus]MBB5018979.1 putative acylesterase/phospholipase RssA [Chitinivorax tropicus]